MSKNKKIEVQGVDVIILEDGGIDYISLTDMLKAKDGEFFISDWLRNRNTIEFLSIWESLNNPHFNYGEIATIKSKAGLNSFKISVKEWVEKTNAIGIVAKTGRYGGTYAHKDIAFEFGTWISPLFKLYLIKEFQKLKDLESVTKNLEWDYRRFLSKVNYRVHTDAIKETIIPTYHNLSKDEERFVYANEAELLNVAVFGITSKQWRLDHVKEALDDKNIRDYATIPQLTVLSNMENLNSIMIKDGVSAERRLERLKKESLSQLKTLQNYNYTYPIDSPHVNQTGHTGTFDQNLKGLLSVPPPKKDRSGHS